ncbi:MAG: hypothetical protein EOO00_08100, partial [Chitinophagaceae bacterium]
MRRLLLITILFFIGAFVFGQADSVLQRIIMVGDAGELKNGRQPELELVRRLYPMKDTNNAVVYLGDNIYPVGLPDAGAKTY